MNSPSSTTTSLKGSPAMKECRTAKEVSAASSLMELDDRDSSPLQSPERRSIPVANTTNTQEEMKNSPVAPTPTKKRKQRSRRKNRHFPSTLFEIIQDRSNSDIVRWIHGGVAFVICDKKRFAAEILPHYFKEAQFTSFTRKLTRWGFQRVSKGKSIGAYYHKLFTRNAPDLCRLMLCNSQNYSTIRSPPSDSSCSHTSDLVGDDHIPLQDIPVEPKVTLPVALHNQEPLHDLNSMAQAREEMIVSSQLRELRSKRIERLVQLQEIEFLKKEHEKARTEQLMAMALSRNPIPRIRVQHNIASDNASKLIRSMNLERERLRMLEKEVLATKLAISQLPLQASVGNTSMSMTPSSIEQQLQARLQLQMSQQHDGRSSSSSRKRSLTRASAA